MTPFRFGLLMAVCAVWGLHFTVIKATIEGVPPVFYAMLRMMVVAVVLSPFLRWHGRHMPALLAAGVGFGGLNYAFMFSGVKLTTASVGAVVLETYIPLATILSVVFLKERIGWRRILGLTLAFSGVIVIVTAGREATGADRLVLGAFLVFCGAFCEAVGAILVKRMKDIPPVQMLAWFGVVGTVVCGLLTLILEDGQVAAFGPETRWPLLWGLSYSVIGASLFGHMTYYWLLQRVPISQVAGATVMTTVFAVTFGVALLGEPLTARFLLGGAITLAGVAVILLRQAAVASDVPPQKAINPEGLAP